MTQFVFWYLLFVLLGTISFPIVFLLLPRLSGRGYAFSKIVGFLLWSYLFWLLGVLGLLKNNIGGILFSLGLVTGLSILAVSRINLEAFAEWWRSHKAMAAFSEVIFLLAFAAWAYVRGLTPEITATEKPMELAFLNAILQSPVFPPADPWLSGYAISYYYFGYVMIAMVSMLTGTVAGVGFNLGIALVFALSATGAYGLVYSMISWGDERVQRKNAGLAVFGPLFVLLVSNLEGFLDMLHARGLFWQRGPEGELVSGFWSWLNLKDLVNAPMEPFSWVPQRFLWWWRASRVVNDLSFTGRQQEVIDEFPFFSFLLSDLHPHVLAIPFVLLAIALALNLFLRKEAVGISVLGRHIKIAPIDLAFGALIMGALAFLNTWDFPIYVALFTGAYILRGAILHGWTWRAVVDGILLGGILGIGGVLLYLPFYFGFSSQAGGVLPNIMNPTRGAHLWVMFGTLFVPLWLYFFFVHSKNRALLKQGATIAFGFIGALWLFTVIIILGVLLQPDVLAGVLEALGAADARLVLEEAFSRRFGGFGGWLTLGLMLSFSVGLLLNLRVQAGDRFALLMIVVGLLLVIGPEFVYLRDLFGSRMNTIFKFYYQAWILMGIASAYASVRIIRDWRSRSGAFAVAVLTIFLLMGLTYPALSLHTKTGGFDSTRNVNLDGTTHNAYLSDDDRSAIAWLLASPRGTLLEAVGGSYSNAARIATHTGYPNVLGWVFHQGQWRGGYEEVGSRESDVARIYETGSWEEAEELLNRYDVAYIYVGSLERTSYNLNETKFKRNLPVVFEQGGVTVFGFNATP